MTPLHSRPEDPVVTARRLKCENSRFYVYFDELHVNGRLHVRDYLTVIPKQVRGDLVTGAAILPVYEGKFGLINVYRHPLGSGLWEMPRGFLEAEEGTMTSALRELEEETGLTCAPEKVRSLGFVAPEPGVLAGRMELFVATECVRTRAYEPVELGHREFQLFDAAAIEEMIRNSEIEDPSTLVAYVKYAHSWFDKATIPPVTKEGVS